MVLTSRLVLNVLLFNNNNHRNNNLPLHLQLEDIQCETVSYPRQKKKTSDSEVLHQCYSESKCTLHSVLLGYQFWYHGGKINLNLLRHQQHYYR